MYIDSHCHLNYLEDPEAALQRARERGVSGCLCIGVEQQAIGDVLSMAAAHEDVWATVGEHPGNCSGDAAWIEAHLTNPDVVAVGEIGLDYHYEDDPARQAMQRKTFEQQLEIAARHALPVIVHTRAAEADTLALLRNHADVRGVLHCYTESVEMAQAAMELGYYISISGIVTFRSADNVREVVRNVPLDRLLFETDAPWLAPVPHRGQKNEPSFVVDTAIYLSELLDMPVASLCEHTRNNFFALFNRAC